MGVFRNVNAPTKVTIQAGADGYVQNRATNTGRGSVNWNSSGMITDTTATHYYTTQDNIRVSAVKSGTLWFCARLLVWFDTSSIPSGKTIRKAKVRLKLKSHNVTQTDYGEILKIYEWDEFAPSGRITTTDFDGFDIEELVTIERHDNYFNLNTSYPYNYHFCQKFFLIQFLLKVSRLHF